VRKRLSAQKLKSVLGAKPRRIQDYQDFRRQRFDVWLSRFQCDEPGHFPFAFLQQLLKPPQDRNTPADAQSFPRRLGRLRALHGT
jgi:hypothetical protein